MILSQWSLIFLAGKLILSSLGSRWTPVKYIQILTHFFTLHIRAFGNQGFYYSITKDRGLRLAVSFQNAYHSHCLS